LLQAVPRLQPGAARARRGAPLPAAKGAAPADSCAFAPRCAYATERCRTERPPLRALAAPLGGVHEVACHVAETVAALPGGEA
jgi:ABC-type dipeptide/oligopeptide/nickel transport system ATPase component